MSRYYHPRRVRKVLGKLARVVCPPDLDRLDITEQILDDVELSMDAMAPIARSGLVAGTLAFDAAAMAAPRHLGRRFAELADDRAAAHFSSWWKSRIGVQREWARGVKGLLCMAYYEMPAVKQRLGFAPREWIERVKMRRLSVYSEAIAAHERRITGPDPLPLTATAGVDPADKEAG